MHTVRRRLRPANVAKRLAFRNPASLISRRWLSASTDAPETSPRNGEDLVILPQVYAPDPKTRTVTLRTLYSKWLTGEDYVDLSDARAIVRRPEARVQWGFGPSAPYFVYGWSSYKTENSLFIKQLPFPVNTRGHFYYSRHSKFPIAGSLRFRLTQNPDLSGKTFTHAQDLKNQYGLPWQIPLLALASSPRYEVVRDVLRQDGYLFDGVVESLQEMCSKLEGRKQIGPASQIVYDTRQPFVLDLARPTTGVTLAGQKELIPVDQLDLWAVRSFGKPFKSGVLLCSFEVHGERFIWMRVLRVIEPVRMAEGYSGPIGLPVVGDYIRADGKPKWFLHRGIAPDGPPIYDVWKEFNPRSHWAYLWNWATYRRRATKLGVHFPYDKEARPPWAR